jgi:hypothetical protein
MRLPCVLDKGTLKLKRVVRDREAEWDARKDRYNPGQSIADAGRQFFGKTGAEICRLVGNNGPDCFAVQQYPPTPSIAYWIYDALEMMRIRVSERASKTIVIWAGDQLARQVSLVVANHHALMDPIAMAMAACLCRCLKRMGVWHKGIQAAMVQHGPSNNELTSAIQQFFAKR